MTNENPADSTPEQVTFGPEPVGTPGRARRTGRAVTWVAVGAIGATVLTGVAFAATNEGSTETPSPSAATPSAPAAPGEGHPGGGPGGHGGRGHGGLFGGLKGDVLHGEFVVKQDDGTTRTMLTQTGAVTAASSTSLTVKSTDGFTATWSLSSSTTVRAFKATSDGNKADATVADLKVGQTVNVVGTKSTDTTGAATAVSVRPTAAQLEELRKNAPQRGDHGNPGEAPTAAPTVSPSKSAA